MFVPEPGVGEGGVAATQPAVATSAAGYNGHTMVCHPALGGSHPRLPATRPHPLPITGQLLVGIATHDPESQPGGRSEQQNTHLQRCLQRDAGGTDPDSRSITSGQLTGQNAVELTLENAGLVCF